jgi:hypothetical protein
MPPKGGAELSASPGIRGRSLRMGAEPSERTLNAGLQDKRGIEVWSEISMPQAFGIAVPFGATDAAVFCVRIQLQKHERSHRH